jgi:hypothetical protein
VIITYQSICFNERPPSRRRIFNTDVRHRRDLHQPGDHFRNRSHRAVDIELQLVFRTRERRDSPEIHGRRCLLKLDPQDLGAQVLPPYIRHAVVHNHAAVVDHDHALGNVFDISRVVTGQEHRHAVSPVPFANEISQFLPGDHVETDRRLVQK